MLLGVRLALLVAGLTLFLVGIFDGGANDVLIKAINICTECIGLG
ncbi:MAG: thioredoxin [Clostridia bacterium]|nr:thioredoxin [Clostridia bacterium]